VNGEKRHLNAYPHLLLKGTDKMDLGSIHELTKYMLYLCQLLVGRQFD